MLRALPQWLQSELQHVWRDAGDGSSPKGVTHRSQVRSWEPTDDAIGEVASKPESKWAGITGE